MKINFLFVRIKVFEQCLESLSVVVRIRAEFRFQRGVGCLSRVEQTLLIAQVFAVEKFRQFLKIFTCEFLGHKG